VCPAGPADGAGACGQHGSLSPLARGNLNQLRRAVPAGVFELRRQMDVHHHEGLLVLVRAYRQRGQQILSIFDIAPIHIDGRRPLNLLTIKRLSIIKIRGRNLIPAACATAAPDSQDLDLSSLRCCQSMPCADDGSVASPHAFVARDWSGAKSV
jgi:hypothetical protein